MAAMPGRLEHFTFQMSYSGVGESQAGKEGQAANAQT